MLQGECATEGVVQGESAAVHVVMLQGECATEGVVQSVLQKVW
jgi:hypothetical protein